MEGEIRPTIAEILSALSYALDITEGQPQGHSVRTCLIASALGERLNLSPAQLDGLFFAALLKDSGSTISSERIQRLFGNEVETRRRVRFLDVRESIDDVARGVFSSIRRLLGLMPPSRDMVEEVVAARCYRGKEIAIQLGFGDEAADTILCLDERWDGSGGPRRLAGDAIPITSRVLSVAQTVELFASNYGAEGAMDAVMRRSGRWFDPEVAEVMVSLKFDATLWNTYDRFRQPDPPALVPPGGEECVSEVGLDEVCQAFASIVDAKSSFTGQHSTRVMEVAVASAQELGVSEERLVTLRRAALLHDVGKLGVSCSILDKNGPLDASEWRLVQEHPRHSYEILRKIRGFRRIAEIASAHHERLDGSGYWRGLGKDEIDLDMRLLATADVFDALSSERPYRPALPLSRVYGIMKEDAGLDQRCVEAVWAAVAMNRSLCAVAG